jgi:hypothetical protein
MNFRWSCILTNCFFFVADNQHPLGRLQLLYGMEGQTSNSLYLEYNLRLPVVGDTHRIWVLNIVEMLWDRRLCDGWRDDEM